MRIATRGGRGREEDHAAASRCPSGTKPSTAMMTKKVAMPAAPSAPSNAIRTAQVIAPIPVNIPATGAH